MLTQCTRKTYPTSGNNFFDSKGYAKFYGLLVFFAESNTNSESLLLLLLIAILIYYLAILCKHCSTFKQELSNQFHFITFHLSFLTTVLDPKQAVPDCPTICESMPPAGYLKNTSPACTPGTSRTNPSPSCHGV